MTKFYVIAGESSGDLHGSNLIKALKIIMPNSQFRCWGGDLMKAQGAEVVKHYRDLAFMGFVEVAKNIRTILKNFKFCKEDILNYKPDALILIDYPGFNLRMAKFAKEQGIPVIYYIAPQIWAWKASRIKEIKKYVDKMLVILPFEKDFYAQYNYPVTYVGHPLLDVINPQNLSISNNTQTIALLPGSRKMEVENMLRLMYETAKKFPQYQFVVAKVSSLNMSLYLSQNKPNNVEIREGNTYELLSNSYAALVTSGTATLETALHKVPQVVCYKGNAITYHIIKRIIKVKYISLVNLISDKPVVKELIQNELTVENMSIELKKITENRDFRNHILSDYNHLIQLLGNSGASSKAALEIKNFLNK
jgi:lipid-A-disaccharide synthase